MARSYLYGYFDKEGECVYIGMATTTVEKRHYQHVAIKEDPKKEQDIDAWLKQNDDWSLVTLGELNTHDVIEKDVNKKCIHSVERILTEEYNPEINKYLTKGGK